MTRFPHQGSTGLSSERGSEVPHAQRPYPGRVAPAWWEVQVQAAGAWLQIPVQIPMLGDSSSVPGAFILRVLQLADYT